MGKEKIQKVTSGFFFFNRELISLFILAIRIIIFIDI